MPGIHPLDLIVIACYLVAVIWLGHRATRGQERSQEGYFLAGRKLGKAYQFFLNFGNATDANGAVSAASLVYQQGVSGVWLGFQLIFLNPYYWFMNTWFRRVRLVTMADLFEDRLGSRRLAMFYALFQIASAVFVVVGFGNLVTYKICAALVLKPEVQWTSEERASVEGYAEWRALEAHATAGTLVRAGAEAEARLADLREREARGELSSYVTALRPVPFYVIYTLVVGFYVILGGLAATAVNEVLQSLIIVAFSVLLVPAGFAAMGGGGELAQRVSAEMFQLLGSAGGMQKITALSLFALFLVALVQINGIIGNMGVGGSAKDEFAARFGAVTGTYAKRLMFILWAFAGLIAVALYHGENALSDPDLAWGTLSRRLLGPGLLGLMITGVLAANMSTVAAQTVSVSALFVRNVLRPMRPDMTELQAVQAGRWAMLVALSFGVLAAAMLTDVFSAMLLVQTVSVPVGAAVMLMFFWRRLTVAGTWWGVLVAISLTVLWPFLVPQIPGVRTNPALTVRAELEAGRTEAVFFENVVLVESENGEGDARMQGQGRLHLELVLLDAAGLDVAAMSPGRRFAARFFFDAALPFLVLIVASLLTRPPEQERLDQFYGRMKTPVGATPSLDDEAMAETRRNPRRFDHTKLFPGSAWEFTRWDKVDAIGFVACCLFSGFVIFLFWSLLRWAAGGF